MTNVFEQCDSLVDLLRLRASTLATKLAYTYLVDGEEPGDTISFGELDRQARMIAAQLDNIDAENERVLMLFAPGVEFLCGFFGCLYAGAIAVPTPSHNPTRLQRSLKRILAVAKGAKPTIGLTTSKLMEKVSAGFDEVPELKQIHWVIVDELDTNLADQWVEKDINSERLAFLQFTSGSTSLPKGVMLTHGNLLHNLECFDYGCGHDGDSVMLTWLPAFHDLGLIYGLLQPLYNGFQCYIISPVAFVQRPMRWLEAISRYRVTHTMGPNFAYESCVQKVTPEQLASLDLSCWRMAMSAAEPVRRGTVDNFSRTFSSCGFRPDALCVAYGLAESTCLVSATHHRLTDGHYREKPRFLGLKEGALEKNRAEDETDSQQKISYLANCGTPKPDMELLIVDPATKTSCQQNVVGEIWIKGPSVAQGYWQRPQESAETFNNYIASGEGPYLSTGDLGFMRDKALYFTGRLKDLIIIRGENHYPQDIEWSVDKCHPKLRHGCCAAFTIEHEEDERLVVVQEVQRNYKKDDFDSVITAIRKTISEQHDLKVYAIALVKTGRILKTSSGKIQRSACKACFKDGTLQEFARWYVKQPPVTQNSLTVDGSEKFAVNTGRVSSSHQIMAFLTRKIDISNADYAKTLVELGLDSMDFTELLVHMQADLDVDISTEALYQKTLSDILSLAGGETQANAVHSISEMPKTQFSHKQENSIIDVKPNSSGEIADQFTLEHFEPLGYLLRFAKPQDIATLMNVEQAALPGEITSSEVVLADRIKTFPAGQFVLERQGTIIGVIYTQRITTIESLHDIQADEIASLHDKNGPVLQLLSLRLLADHQGHQLENQLLAFVLHQATRMSGVRSVVGITRCSNYSEHLHTDFVTYIRGSINDAWLQEPTLRFHHTHGAKITGIIANYQPLDVINQGYGVLFHYKLKHYELDATRVGNDVVNAAVNNVIEKRESPGLGPTLQSNNAVIHYLQHKIDVTAQDYHKTLAELGLDSMDFAELLVYMQEVLDVDISTNDLYQKKLSDVLLLCETSRRGSATAPISDLRLSDSAISDSPLSHSLLSHLPLNKRIRSLMRQFPEIVPLSINGEGCCTFWIHPLSGDVGVYNNIATKLDNAFKLIGIKARGFLSQEHAPLSDPFAMAKYYTRIIMAVDPQGPYHIAGFSLGGTIGYEVARQLQMLGKKVNSLLLVEAPFISGEEPELFQTTRRNNLLMNANFLLLTLLSIDQSFSKKINKGEINWQDFRISNKDISQITDEALLDYLVANCRQKGINQSEGSLRFKLTSMADVHLANLEAIQSYRVAPLPFPEKVDAWLFRTRSALATSTVLWNPDYLENIQQKKGSLLPLLHPWESVLPNLNTIILDGENHFDVMRSDEGIQVFLGHCKKIFSNGTVNKGDELRRSGNKAINGRTDGEKGVYGAVPIAIIGMSGRFPDADNVNAFWNNLKNGRNSITEMPDNRGWDINDYFDPKPQTPDKTYSKWGGFLTDIDQFDPLFFGISPREAEYMDPSERIFLQEAWKAIEDAGYAASGLSGKSWGVFAYAKGDYPIHVQQLHHTYLSPTDSSAPSRLSYLLNLVGPAVSVDTACSSTLTAIAYACDSLVLGNSAVAIAGGGSVYTTPNLLVSSSQSLLFSPDGQCYTFDERANGTVLAEAIGVVVLKPLDQAVTDDDNIHGVIKGWGTNQDGKTNGLTAPSVSSQTRLESEVYRKFNINPERISMVEAHGTGTKLGDPVEVQALTDAFQRYTKKTGYCALGSLKTNIGHAFGGAGVSGLIKVLLSMKHKQIPPSLNCNSINPFMRIEKSPFYVNTVLKGWDSIDDQPRYAAVNSFGATGINAHLVVEEYIRPCRDKRSQAGAAHQFAIVLSAKTAEQLKENATHLLNELTVQSEENLTSVAYTLQLGRDAMEERLAIIVTSIDELKNKLTAYLKGGKHIEYLYRGQVKRSLETWDVFSSDEDMKNVIDGWLEKAKYPKLLDLWVKGMSVDWSKLYGASKPGRISLPTYSFAKERYWLSKPGNERSSINKFYSANTNNNTSNSASNNANNIHPLLHSNTSNLSEQRFSALFTGDEFFLKDHVVRGQRTLPAVVYLEMAYAAVKQSIARMDVADEGVRLKNVVWVRPLSVSDQSQQLHISLYSEDNEKISYEIFTETDEDDGDRIIHSQGVAEVAQFSGAPTVNLPDLQGSCSQGSILPGLVYENFSAAGVDFGSGHRGIEKIYYGDAKTLAKLSLPSSVSDTLGQFVLHPSMLDSALQAVVGLASASKGNGVTPSPTLSLPFALDEITIRGACTASMWALIRYSDGCSASDRVQKLDIELCDDQGAVLVQMRGFSSRAIAAEMPVSTSLETQGSLMFEPYWVESALTNEKATAGYMRNVVILCEMNPGLQQRIIAERGDVDCLYLSPQQQGQGIQDRFQHYAIETVEKIQAILHDKSKGRVFIQLVYPLHGEQELLVGLSALLKSAQLENPNIVGQLIGVDASESVNSIGDIIKNNAFNANAQNIQYRDGNRWVLSWKELVTQNPVQPSIQSPPENGMMDMPWKEHGVYLITGGSGGLGMLFASEIIRQVTNVTLILTGRTALGVEAKKQIQVLESKGAKIHYLPVDVTNQHAVNDLFVQVRKNHETLNGIIHAAGVIRDNYIINKTAQEFRDVTAPKVSGLVNVDQASQHIELDFFILFSSLAAGFGNVGQADYATANAFMDAYAGYRNRLVVSKRRQGHTIAINWPLWQEGGMKIDAGVETLTKQAIGLVPMRTATGIQTLYQALTLKKQQVMVMEGQLPKMKQLLLSLSGVVTPGKAHAGQIKEPLLAPIVEPIAEERQAGNTHGTSRGALEGKTIDYFKQLLSLHIKLPVQRIDETAPLEKFGIDSIMAMALTNKLEAVFGSLSKTLFFEYQTIEDLAGYFLDAFPARLSEILGIEDKNHNVIETSVVDIKPKHSVNGAHKGRRFQVNNGNRREGKGESRDIAIIGLSGRYPLANDLEAFWENLRDGKDCITEIPDERWDHSQYFDPERNKTGKSYSKWGGFIAEVDQFDPLFFNISPREAALMDPQERLFLETVWNLFESAGYTRESLQETYQNRIGVYVGAMYQQYHAFESDIVTEAAVSLSSYSAIANRVSHYFNFQGPSIAIDTMCSSALTSIHMACENLILDDCQLAVAGGVNLSIHPKKYIGLSQAQIIGSHVDSRSFANGDGYIPAEGVGAVLLKRLSNAIDDGDTILAVIKSSATNHSGRSNGFAVPNPAAQSQLIEDNFKKSGVDPSTISYIESAANGSALGDPIELAALNKVFKKPASGQPTCAIGSVKSNIGHAEAASGMSQLTKVILQMQHKQLVPSIKAAPLNPNVNFDHSPFHLQTQLEEWKQPVVDVNGLAQAIPRRATISAFGAAGSNAHLILEEYSATQEAGEVVSFAAQEHIMLFSARNQNRLLVVAQQMLAFLENNRDISLTNLAYTLQVGREAMESRLSMVVRNHEALLLGLKEYIASCDAGKLAAFSQPVFMGDLDEENLDIISLFSGNTGKTIIASLMLEKNLAKLALYWAKGGNVTWQPLHDGTQPKRITLPTYPFDRRRCWIDSVETGRSSTGVNSAVTNANVTNAESNAYNNTENNPSPFGVKELKSLNREQSSLADRVAGIAAGILGMQRTELRLNRSLDQYGFDSVLLMQLLQQLQAHINPAISATDLQACKTINDIVNALSLVEIDTSVLNTEATITDATITVPKSWSQFPELILLNRFTKGRPVFWLHAAIGGVEAYQRIAGKSQRPFYGIQARGWMTDRPPLHGIQAMAAYYVNIIRSVQAEGPYDLGGYSVGGAIAYEVARQLQESGQIVGSIVMLDTLDTSGLKQVTPSTKTNMLQAINTALGAVIQQNPVQVATQLIHREEVDASLAEQEYLSQLITLAKKRGMTKTKTQLSTQISQSTKVQLAYEIEKYEILPLPDPDGIACHYFRNMSGLFFGELEPYFSLEADDISTGYSNYWQEWKKQLPNFNMIDVDSSNHMMLLAEPKSLTVILELCEILYTEPDAVTGGQYSLSTDIKTNKSPEKRMEADMAV